jgi:type III secretory pathway component EscS
MENKGKKMLRLILRIFDKLGSSDADLVESCFKMIKKIILTNKEFLANS